MRIVIVGAATLLVASTAPVLAAPAAGLAPKDIQSTFFTGQPFTSATPTNVKYKMVFMTDGKMTREPLGKSGGKGEGSWKLSKNGFCTTWKGSKVNCFHVVPNGANKWSVMKGTTLAAVWTK